MPLEIKTQSMPFTQGPDTKNDQKLAVKPSRLENAVFRGGTLAKRFGRAALPTALDTGGNLTQGEALFTFNNELVRINGGATYGLSPEASEWITKPGGLHYNTVTKKQLVRNSSSQSAWDQAVVNGVAVLAWVGSAPNAGIHIAVYDTVSGTFYQTGSLALANSSGLRAPRCVVLGSKVLVLVMATANTSLAYTTVDTASPEAAPPALVATGTLYSLAQTFDAFAYNSSYAVIVAPSSGTDLTLSTLDANGNAPLSPQTIAGAASAAGLRSGIFAKRTTNGNIFTVYADVVAHSTKWVIRDPSLMFVQNPATIVSNGNWSGGNAEFYSAAGVELTTNNLTVIMCQGSAPSANPGGPKTFLGKSVLSLAGSSFTEIPTTSGMTIMTDVVPYDGDFVFGAVNGDLVGPTVAGSTVSQFTGLQASAWVLNLSGLVVARALVEKCGGPASSTPRASRPFLVGPAASFLFGEQGRLSYSSSGSFTFNTTPLGISQITVTPAKANALAIQQLGETVYVGGGLPRVYDGQSVYEAGFALYPTLSTLAMAGSGGSLSAGQYQYSFVYSFISAQGELVRGIPSPGAAATITAVLSDKANIAIAPMPESMRDLLPSGALVTIEVYRTIANGTVFYRQSSVQFPNLNVTTYISANSGTINIADGTSDAALQSGELLYTTGGILDWEPPPAYSAACVHEQRLIIVGLEDPYTWMPSSQSVAGEQIRFSSFTLGHVPADTGPLVGCASMDGTLFLFTSQAAYSVSGNGPDQLGNNPYPPTQRVTSVDVGPINATSIVSTPLGIIYQSTKGLMLLDRSLNTSLIGADVQEYSTAPYAVKSGLVDATQQYIRFLADPGSDIPGTANGVLNPTVTSDGGVSLVYDYYYQQWSVFTNYGGQDNSLYQGRYTMIRSDGLISQETPNAFLDFGASFSSVVETAWVKAAGLQGFQRFYYAILLGTYGSDFTLVWDVALNYQGSLPTVPTYTQTVQLVGNGVFALGGPFQARHHLGHKCSAVKFRFTDTNVQGNGQGMQLSDMTIEYGILPRGYRLPANQTL